jgi:hypothetical protein
MTANRRTDKARPAAHRSPAPGLDPYVVQETTLTLQQLRKVRNGAHRVHVVQRQRSTLDAA